MKSIALLAGTVAATDQTYLTAQLCDAKRASQQWDFADGRLKQRGTGSPGECADIHNYGTADLSTVWEFNCHPEDTAADHQNQLWTYDTVTKEVYVPDKGTAKGKRLDCSNYCADGPGSTIWIYHKTNATNQQWSYDETTGLLKSMQTKYSKDLCLDSENPPQPRACDVSPGKGQPWCDHTLDLEKRVADLVSRIPEESVVGLFSNGASGVPSLNIPSYQWWSEALHGVGGSPGVSFSGSTPYATSFPQVILTASSFNTSLFKAIGGVISTEARAFNNQGHAGNTFWAPNINIYRDPRWGRGQETPGEDPTLNGDYASNFVPGMQEGEDPHYIKASSCLKHFAAYNLENWGGKNRHNFDAIVSEQDLQDTYYPAFKAGVTKGKASGIMCSYNSVNGVPSCANKGLLNDLARDQWKFNGYITSDCGAVNDVYANHKYDTDQDRVCKDVLEAGMDSDCGGYLASHMHSSMSKNVTTKADYDAALSNMFRVRMRLGHFDPASIQPYLAYGVDRINTPDHQALALEAARQGIVLLKNDVTSSDKKALPFAASSVKNIALIGPNAAATGTMQGNYQGDAPYLISPQAGLAKFATVNYQQGCAINSADTSGFAAATEAAAAADATVLIIGLDGRQEGEGHDRTNVTLPGVQADLIEAVAAKAKGPLTLVVMSGGALDISAAKADSRIASILWVGYPGQSGGQAIAEVLFGKVNPSGKLTQTWYPASYLDKCSFFDMNMRPNTTTGCPGRSHRFYTGPTVYKFGDGLSYSSFDYTITATNTAHPETRVLELLRNDASAETVLAKIQVRVENTGSAAGDEVSLMFVRPPAGTVGAPVQQLKGYQRTFLAAGDAKVLDFEIKASDLSYADANGLLTTHDGLWTVEVGGVTTSIQLHKDALVV